jgi:copper oxidase (laccase) domain-containing protein
MNISIWVIIGIATSWAGYNIVLKRKSNQENSKKYYDYFADKKDKYLLDLKQIMSLILYQFGYLLFFY